MYVVIFPLLTRTVGRRHVTKITGFILVAIVGFSIAFAYEEYPGMSDLTGQFDITGKTAVDPKPDEPSNTHFRIFLTGEAAKTLYEHMEIKPVTEWCGEPEGPVKRIDSMMCIGSPRADGYKCWFAIDIANQDVSGGWAAC